MRKFFLSQRVYSFLCGGLLSLAQAASAESTSAPLNISLPSVTSYRYSHLFAPEPSQANTWASAGAPFLLAANQSASANTPVLPTPTRTDNAKPPVLFHLNGTTTHAYLAYTTMLLLGATILTRPEEGKNNTSDVNNSPHHKLAYATTAFAAATVTTGLVAHWDDFKLSNGWLDPDNAHVLLGTAGLVLMVAAVSQAPHGGHASSGILGGVAMGGAIAINF